MSSKANRYFFLWIKPECPYCQKASDMLAEREYPHTLYNLDNNPELMEKVKGKFNWRTVPMVVEQRNDGESTFIGGCDDLEKHLEQLHG